MKYAIKYHSEMTDIDLYFISDRKQHIDFNRFINDYSEFMQVLDRKHIKLVSSEDYDFNTDIENQLEIIAIYSTRF